MSKSLLIRLKELGKEGEELYIKLCRVVSVNADKRIMECEPLDGTANILDVRLTASANDEQADDDHFCLYPKVHSIVAIGFLDSNEAVLCLVSEIDKAEIKIGKTILTIDQNKYDLKVDKIEFNTTGESKLRASIFDFANQDGISLKSIINRTIDEIMKIIVISGTSPNIGALSKIKDDNNKLLK